MDLPALVGGDPARQHEVTMRRYWLAILFWLHSLVHVIGFATAWRWIHFNGVSPTFPGGVVAGGPALQLLGLAWALAAAAFVTAAVGVASRASWWTAVAAGAALLSLVLCLGWWTDAKFGATIDVAILVGLAVNVRNWRRKPWVPPVRTPRKTETDTGSVSYG